MRTTDGSRQRGFTLLELLGAASLSGLVIFGVSALLNDGTRAHAQQAENYHLRTHAGAALRKIARELEQSSTESPNFAVGASLTFNLPASIGATTVWGPPITYRVTGGRLVREEGSTSLSIMASCAAFETALDGQRVNLKLTAEGGLARDGAGVPRRPRYDEQADVILLPD